MFSISRGYPQPPQPAHMGYNSSHYLSHGYYPPEQQMPAYRDRHLPPEYSYEYSSRRDYERRAPT